MNGRLFLAGAFVLIAGLDSPYDHTWVVIAFGLAMIVAAVLPAIGPAASAATRAPIAPSPTQPPPYGQKRERWTRETRERYWPFDKAA